MAEQKKIVVEGASRAERGKNEARRLRQTGKVPAVLYGGKGAPWKRCATSAGSSTGS